MKIAAIVYGMYTDFEVVYKFWDFAKHLDIDFYFSTWKKSYKLNNTYGTDFMFDVEENMIKNIIPNATISINDEQEFNYYRYVEKRYNTGKSSEKMFFHWKNGLRMIKESNKSYDQLALLRIDMVYKFNDSFDLLYLCNEEKKIYNHNLPIVIVNNKHYVNDTFFIGNYNVMENLITSLNLNTNDVSHYEIAKTIISLDYTIEKIGYIEDCLIRPNIKLYKNEELNWEKINKYYSEWS